MTAAMETAPPIVHHPGLVYRPDIDGLRAIAVTSVLLLHAGFTAFAGGYVGVDVFFVISGYLITRIIVTQIDKGTFSLYRFYENRIRRILPALCLVATACLPAGYFLMLPDPFQNLGQSVVSTILSSNNILLTMTAGYWTRIVDFKPLMHTWSLGVEEQFYMLFPMALMLIAAFSKRRYILWLLAGFVISLAASQWGTHAVPIANFYQLPFRAWELLAGGLCACLQPRIAGRGHGPALTFVGLGLIALAVFTFNPSTPFPSVYALVPIVGAMLIILFGDRGGAVAKLLGSRLMVGMGLISYSAYLWHQPLYAFLRVYSRNEPTKIDYVFAIAATIFLSIVTWRFVEVPFRRRLSTRTVLCSTGSAAAILVVVGLGLHFSNGLPGRLVTGFEARPPDLYIQFNERVRQLQKPDFTSIGKVRVLVLGDSFARDVVNMITETLPVDRIEIVYQDDFDLCISDGTNDLTEHLITQANVIVFGSGNVDADCIHRDIAAMRLVGKHVFYADRKHFGYNLNWVMRVSREERKFASNELIHNLTLHRARLLRTVPEKNFINITDPMLDKTGRMIFTDGSGELLSIDRVHLTRQGARFVGRRALNQPAFLASIGLPTDYFSTGQTN